MEIIRNRVIYMADDEEPNCLVCNNQDCDVCCENCGPKFGCAYYEREEEK